MFLEYIPGKSLVHRLDVRTKIWGFITLLTLGFIFPHPLYTAIVGVLSFLLALYIPLPMKRIWALLRPLLPIFAIIVVITGFSYGTDAFVSPYAQKVLFYAFPASRLPFTSGGLLYGLNLLLRIFIMVITSSILTLTTPLEDFLQVLGKLRVPYEFSFIITTGIRFVPTMEAKASMVMDAQRARGARLETGGMISRIRAYVPVMVPLLVNAIRMSENMALAMLNRGFGATRKWTYLREISLEGKDYLALVFITVMFLLGVYIRYMMNYGQL